MATSICLFENLESEQEISSTDRLGADYTYVALGMMNTTAVYKYDYRYKALSYLTTIVGHSSYVAGTILSNPDQRITDLKFWKRMRSYKEYQFQYPTVYLSIAVNKKLYILNIPSKRKNNVRDNSQRILQITEIVIGGSISIATTNREDKTVLSQQSDEKKD